MHQLRIQSASRGHAIVGDLLYGSHQVPDGNRCETHSTDRILLHAWNITFHDPKNGKKMAIPCPNDEFSSLV
jgi:23S rRNA-/tRNA-specific pseudouridylate synthase